MSWSYILALVVDCIGILIALYFIMGDPIRYSRPINNVSLSLVTMVFAVWVAISYYLYHHEHPSIASGMAWLPAIPLLGYGFFVLLFIILKPDMK